MAMNPRLLRPTANDSPASIPGLALWLDAAAADALYTTDAGPVTAVSSPLDIAGCALWLDGADSSAASMTLDGTSLDAWKDKSGNGRDFTAAGAARPTLTAAGLNGLSVVTLDGNDQMTNATNIVGLTSVSMFAVAFNDGSQFGGVISSTAGTDSSPGLLVDQFHFACRGLANLSRGTSGSGPIVATGIVSSGASAVFYGGLQADADAASGSLAAVTTTAIGTYRQTAANFLTGYIAEIIVFNTALSTSDRARVEAYLANKWSIANVHAPAVTASDPVGYWRDRSGNGRHATQSTAASRPVVQPSQINSRAVIRFDGTDDRMAIPSLGAQAFTVICVGKKWSATTDAFIALGNTANFVPYAIADLTGLGTYGTKSTGGANGVFAGTTTRRLLSTSPFLALQDSAISIRVDGAPLDLNDTGTSAASVTSFSLLGAKTGGGNIFGKQEFGELLVYDRALTAAERRKVEVYLARRWGITLAPQVSNAEAQDWISRVYANGGTVSTSTASAVSTFCDAIEAAGIRDRFYRLGIFSGDNLNAALVPLYRGPTFGGTTYGNATDTNNGPFVSGDYAETGASGGLKGNGTSKYLDTGYFANTLAASNSHFGVGLLATDSMATGDRSIMGAWNGSNNIFELRGRDRGPFLLLAATMTRFATAGDRFGDDVNESSLAVGNIVAAWPTMYRNGVASGTDATSSQDFPAATKVYVFNLNNNNTNVTNYTNARLGWYSIGATMTAAQALSYHNALADFNTALSRT